MRIETGIPVAEKAGGRSLQYPWNLMAVGESIVVHERTAGKYAIKAHRSWEGWATRNGITDRCITSRSIGKGRVRIWVETKAQKKGRAA